MWCQARLALEGDALGWVEEGLSDCGQLSRDQEERLDEPVTHREDRFGQQQLGARKLGFKPTNEFSIESLRICPRSFLASPSTFGLRGCGGSRVSGWDHCMGVLLCPLELGVCHEKKLLYCVSLYSQL